MLLDAKKLLARLIVVTAGALMFIGMVNVSGMCFQSGSIFPEDAFLLDRSLEAPAPNLLFVFMAKKVDENSDIKGVLIPFNDVAEYRSAYPDCCGIVRDGHIPQEILQEAFWLIHTPSFSDKVWGRGRYVGYARHGAMMRNLGSLEVVRSSRLSLFWVDRCGNNIPVPGSRQIG